MDLTCLVQLEPNSGRAGRQEQICTVALVCARRPTEQECPQCRDHIGAVRSTSGRAFSRVLLARRRRASDPGSAWSPGALMTRGDRSDPRGRDRLVWGPAGAGAVAARAGFRSAECCSSRDSGSAVPGGGRGWFPALVLDAWGRLGAAGDDVGRELAGDREAFRVQAAV